MSKIGYLGPVGTFAEEAAQLYVKGRTEGLVGYTDIPELIMAVQEGSLDLAVVPVENALEGTVNITVDVLVHEVDIKIVGEIIIPIHHCLLTVPGIDLNDIRGIVSHPQALAQCRKFLYANFKGIPVHSSNSTAAGAKEVIESDTPLAAIGNRRAAEVFGLHISKEDIEDQQGNCTRFIVLSKDGMKRSGVDKTSIVFTVDDEPGSLLHALMIFAEHQINLKKIESRPMRTHLGQYLFFVDFEGHIEDEKVSNVIDLLKKRSIYFKHLGSYPRELSF